MDEVGPVTRRHGDDGAPVPGEPSAGAGRLTTATRELLAGLDETPLEEHPQVYDGLHRRLVAALDPPAGAPAPGPAGRRG